VRSEADCSILGDRRIVGELAVAVNRSSCLSRRPESRKPPAHKQRGGKGIKACECPLIRLSFSEVKDISCHGNRPQWVKLVSRDV